eukprot:gb/GFBE01082767.1/.p1 GENE.gb/GFBE01082767.1/~~gb/GFBE01082767.1/.p1  ORF type:complete len:211 (+),score=25.62 gb/GFBE01082767.1/:1-633(+)
MRLLRNTSEWKPYFVDSYLPVVVNTLSNARHDSKEYSRSISKLSNATSILVADNDEDTLARVQRVVHDSEIISPEFHEEPPHLLGLRLSNKAYLSLGKRGERPQQYHVQQKAIRYADSLVGLGLGEEVERLRPTLRCLRHDAVGRIPGIEEDNPWRILENLMTDASRLLNAGRFSEAREKASEAEQVVKAVPLLHYKSFELQCLTRQIAQ